MSDYKHTLNLPETGFPMRGNLAKLEPVILKRWYEEDLYRMIRTAKNGKKPFILHDGPPYANGSIHIGHSINKILKDIIIKSKGLSGFDSPYIPGWDCHGLPIELQVERLYGKPGNKMNMTEFFQKCRKYAMEQVEDQKKDFIRLGVLGDWENPYLTMNFKTEANIIRTLAKIISNGHLLRGTKPVHWCTECASSLAEAEVEHHEKTSPSIYVAFHATDPDLVAIKFGVICFDGPISLLIWTTTPWTLPANRAISLNPYFEYKLVQVAGQCLILASERVEIVMKLAGILKWIVLGSCKGHDLAFLLFQNPLMSFNVPSILGTHVVIDTGTGVVHTAGSHGLDDFVISQKYGLETPNLVGINGCYLTGTHPLLDGYFIFNANEIIIDFLRDKGLIIHEEKIVHSHPYCWRHKIPIIFRTTPQWFISMDKNGLRKKSIKKIKDVRWIPPRSRTRIETMLASRADWCISRQRTWGVPMALWVHKDTEKLHPRILELIEEVAKRVEKEGIQAWWNLDSADILGPDASNYKKVLDTLDVWFDSGSTHTSVVDVYSKYNNHEIDMFLEGSDQHRGWFMSSLIISTAISNQAPYKEVLSHGFAVDGFGRKMSKSIGNTMRPQEIIKELSGDILRLWVASTDYTSDISVSNEILKRTADSYRRLRNTARFFLSNLNRFEPSVDCVDQEEMVALDTWAIGRALSAQLYIKKAYANYDFHEVVQRLMHFCSIEMGAFYLDVIKDRQYTAKSDSIPRRSCQTALFYIAEAFVRWISPIISFTAHEIWEFLPGKRAKYVFTEEWYNGLFALEDNKKMNDAFWSALIDVRSEVNNALEQARAKKQIGSPLEAEVILYAGSKLADQLNSLKDELHFFLMISVAHVSLLSDAPVNARSSECIPDLKIVISRATGKKCQRCWHYTNDVGSIYGYEDICCRCIKNIAGDGERRYYV